VCRFAAYHGDPLSPATLVFNGEHSLYSQSWSPREMLSGTVNGDGLGVAWYSDGRPIRLLSDRPAWHTPHHRPLLESVASTSIVASVRNATEGLGIDKSSVAPLAFDRWTLTLNGYVTDFRAGFMRSFRTALPDDLYGNLVGSSDTETLFMLLVSRLRENCAPADALRDLVAWVVERVSEEGSTTQLNLALTDGMGLWVTRAGSLPQSNSLYVTSSWTHAPAGVTVASEPLDAGDWLPVPDQSVVSVEDSGVSIDPI
jgi:gamma-glutamyl hercynylcysteine S-oxide hydrolase